MLLSNSSRKENLIKSFENYVKYKDVYFYTWKILKKKLPNIQGSGDTFMLNALDLIEKIPVPSFSRKENADDFKSGALCKTKGKVRCN